MWPFHLLTGASVLAAGLGLHRQRLRRVRRFQDLEQQRALEQERTRIARDLHDDLGATPTGVALQVSASVRQCAAD
jgi:signal transduction histidine kinase